MNPIVWLLEWARSPHGRAFSGWVAILCSIGLWWWMQNTWSHIEQRLSGMETFIQSELRQQRESAVPREAYLEDRAERDATMARLVADAQSQRTEIVRMIERVEDKVTAILQSMSENGTVHRRMEVDPSMLPILPRPRSVDPIALDGKQNSPMR